MRYSRDNSSRARRTYTRGVMAGKPGRCDYCGAKALYKLKDVEETGEQGPWVCSQHAAEFDSEPESSEDSAWNDRGREAVAEVERERRAARRSAQQDYAKLHGTPKVTKPMYRALDNALIRRETRSKTSSKGAPYTEDAWCLYTDEGEAVVCTSESTKGQQRYGLSRERAEELVRTHKVPGPIRFEGDFTSDRPARLSAGAVVLYPEGEVSYAQGKGIGLSLGGLDTYCPSALRRGSEKLSNAQALTAMGLNRGSASKLIEALMSANVYGVNLENAKKAAKAREILAGFGVSCKR